MLYVPTATHEVGDVQDTDTRMATEDATDGVVRIVHVAPSQAIAKASRLVLSDEPPTATHEVVEMQETEERSLLSLPTFGLGTTAADST